MAGRRGFTLIEIVLVLAIAGLLLVIVFLAVGQVQKARRDAQRKQDLAAFVAGMAAYAGEHQLLTPDDETQLDDMLTSYMSNRKDPLLGANYVGDFWNRGAPHDLDGTPPEIGHIAYIQGHQCGKDEGATTIIADPPFLSGTTRLFAAVLQLEQSGTMYCISGKN